MHYFLHALLHAWQKRYRGFKFIFVRILRMKIYGLVNVGKNTKKGTSSTNLLNHIRALHSEFERMRQAVSYQIFPTNCSKKRKQRKNRQLQCIFAAYVYSPNVRYGGTFFSSACYAYSDYRQNLLPMKLEMQLFLKVNHRLWWYLTANKLQLIQLLIVWICRIQLIW